METPIVLITGFSGAGKTTLYENLMAEDSQVRALYGGQPESFYQQFVQARAMWEGLLLANLQGARE
jgi:predicted ATPase